MPDNDDRDSHEQPVRDSREAQIRHNWWSNAKDFILKMCRMYEVGHNAIFSEQHFTAHNQWILLLGAPSTSYTEQAEAREPDQHRHRQIPAAQDSHGSRDEAAEIAPVQEPQMPLQTNSIPSTSPSDLEGSASQEEEVIVIYTDPEVPSDNSTAYSHTFRSRTHIYHLEMLIHKAGYPLYMPTPLGGLPASHQENGIRVGDVGLITANGAFHFLFNACQHHSQSDAEMDSPIDYSKLLKPKIVTSKKFDPNTYLSGVCVSHNETGDHESPPTFQCTSDSGAVLALPKGAIVYEAGNRRIFQTYASRHALSWYEYVLNDGIDVSNGSLYFVTECTKSMDWGIAVFYARSRANHNLRFLSDGETCRWNYRGKVEARIGSQSTDMTVSGGGEPNQCVFLRGYKIMLRPDIWVKLNSATTVISQDGGSPSSQTSSHSTNYGTPGSGIDSVHQSTNDNRSTPDSSHSRLEANQLTPTQVLQGGSKGGSAKTTEDTGEVGQVILENFFDETAPLHPSDLINVMLLNLKPEATVALAHDSEWCDHLPDDFIVDPITPNVDGLLENINRSYRAVIDEHGSAVLLENSLEIEVQVTCNYSPDLSEHDKEASGQHDLPHSSAANTTPPQSQTSTPSITFSPPNKDSRSHISRSPGTPAATLVQTTDEAYPRFRILVVGRYGAGKSSLINAICKASPADTQRVRPGTANMNKGIISPHDKHLILYDSEDYAPYNSRGLEKFITEQTQKESSAERLHAIWLCIPASYPPGHLFGVAEEKIFQLKRNKVPIIIVITKFDLYVVGLQRRAGMKNKISYQSAEDDFKKNFGHIFNKTQGQYTLVSNSQSHTLQRLIQVTRGSIGIIEIPGASSGHGRGSEEDRSGLAAQFASEVARQRASTLEKIKSSIEAGTSAKYWTASSGQDLEKCFSEIHKDFVTIWNIQGLHDHLYGDAFRRRIINTVEDLKDDNTVKITMTSAMAGSAKPRTSSVVLRRQNDLRCLMGYVVNLTLILQYILRLSLRVQFKEKVTLDRMDEIIYQFHSSEKKKNIHGSIRKFIEARYSSFTRNEVENEILSLIEKNEMTQNDAELDKEKPAVRLLLPLVTELSANGLKVTQTIRRLMGELLALPDYRGIASDLGPSDVEPLLDLILYLLKTNNLSKSGIPDANQKARKLMFELISEKGVIPRSFYITGVRFDTVGRANFESLGRISKGRYEGKAVALKQFEKDVNHENCREALAWRSLSHPFILPLLGIFREDAHLFFVSPYMEKGTLSNWRTKNDPPVLSEIHRLMFEVAEGLRYLHSEGIVHGDLTREDILLDSDLHCQIVYLGSTRQSELKLTAGGEVAFSANFAAPELFGMCIECGKINCDRWVAGHEIRKKTTMETDVYSFGCLYYSTFFNTIPFGQENTNLDIRSLLISGKRPARLESPIMEDNIWNLIQSCWKPKPSARPKIKQIASSLAQR